MSPQAESLARPGGERSSGDTDRLATGSTLRRDYAGTYAVEILTLLAGLVLFHLVAVHWGPDGFSYYQVARGMIATLQPVVMVGLVIGLQRYLPRAGAGARSLGRRTFLLQLLLVTGVGVLGWTLAAPLADMLAVHGGVGGVRAIFLALAGICLLATVLAALRGTGQVAAANVSTLIGLGAVPLICVVWVTGVEVFLVVQGVVMAGVAVVALKLVHAPAPPGAPEAGWDAAPRLSEVLRYGARRVPGDVALPALYAFPTVFVSSAMGGGPEAGYVGFTTSAIVLVCSLFATLTPVLLPRLSRSLAGPSLSSAAWRRLRALPIVACGLAGLVVAVLFLLAPLIVRVYLGPEFAEAVTVLRLGLLSAVALAAFYAARPVLDALQDKPVTVPLLVGCLAVEVVTTYLASSVASPVTAAILGLGAGASALGLSSYAAVIRATARMAGSDAR